MGNDNVAIKNGRLNNEAIAEAFRKAVGFENLLGQEDTAVIFYDLAMIQQRLQKLQSLFPKNTLHAVAVKANPLASVLERITGMDAGLEVASFPELMMAIAAGCAPENIVFDSPAKTKDEIRQALEMGCIINADNLYELARIDEILKKFTPDKPLAIGVRINPQVGLGSIVYTSVAGAYSKFGVPLAQYRQELIQAYVQYPWLSGVHCHIGSQGVSMDMLLQGADTLMAFINEVNQALDEADTGRRITMIDIGGGFPVAYHKDQDVIKIEDYVAALKKHSMLFAPDIKLVTEFGRWVHANAGWTASRVEYVKPGQEKHTAMIHVGADMFLRKCYRPDDWHHEVIVLDAKGYIKTGVDDKPYNIAGPLCFAGDIIARDIYLPKLEEGDHIIITDTGAYTLSMWSRYNSRQIPKVLGYVEQGNRFEVLRERESLGDLVGFWR